MGVYTEYLDRKLTFQDLTKERKAQLKRISDLRGGRDVLVFAADLAKANAPISITYPDILPITDQLANLKGDKLDLILETPGGYGEVAEDIIDLLRAKYETLGVIVPGWAKSAGTIMVMAADEILMGPTSALGPIDAQLSWQGKSFSADALLEGFEKIKKEVQDTGILNKAYIPILQGISPGELQTARNALDFSQILVKNWLCKFKFKNWTTHSKTGLPVTPTEREARAGEIAKKLSAHQDWLTHGRSIKIADLEAMGLRITDYSKSPDLADALVRYNTLLQMTFATNIYKIFETPESQILRFTLQAGVPLPQPARESDAAMLDFQCGNCKASSRIQANLEKSQPIQPGSHPFPSDNKFRCPHCGAENDLSEARRQIEAQAKKPVVT